jgi:hypothetical protein
VERILLALLGWTACLVVASSSSLLASLRLGLWPPLASRLVSLIMIITLTLANLKLVRVRVKDLDAGCFCSELTASIQIKTEEY